MFQLTLVEKSTNLYLPASRCVSLLSPLHKETAAGSRRVLRLRTIYCCTNMHIFSGVFYATKPITYHNNTKTRKAIVNIQIEMVMLLLLLYYCYCSSKFKDKRLHEGDYNNCTMCFNAIELSNILYKYLCPNSYRDLNTFFARIVNRDFCNYVAYTSEIS